MFSTYQVIVGHLKHINCNYQTLAFSPETKKPTTNFLDQPLFYDLDPLVIALYISMSVP